MQTKTKKSEENLNAGGRIYSESYSAKQKRLERKTSEIKDMLLKLSCNEQYSIPQKTINTTIDDAQQEISFSTCESILEGKLCAGILNHLKLQQIKKFLLLFSTINNMFSDVLHREKNWMSPS